MYNNNHNRNSVYNFDCVASRSKAASLGSVLMRWNISSDIPSASPVPMTIFTSLPGNDATVRKTKSKSIRRD